MLMNSFLSHLAKQHQYQRGALNPFLEALRHARQPIIISHKVEKLCDLTGC